MKFLDGVRVIDLTRLLPGPACTMHLQKLGAAIIKIEAPFDGDSAKHFGLNETRETGAPIPAAQISPFYELLNCGKTVLTLDLKDESGVATLLDLIKTADVVIESFRPGVTKKLGIDFERVKSVNPKIVYCAITGYGQHGAWANRAGHDINYLAVSGVLDQIGEAGGPPVIPNIQIADLLGGASAAAMEILAALLAVQRTEHGAYLDISMTHQSYKNAIVPQHTLALTGRAPLRGQDFLSGAYPCYNVYRTRDNRYIAVGALEQKFWLGVCNVLKTQHLAALGHTTGSVALRVKRELQDIFATRSMREWTEIFEQSDCCVTPVLTIAEANAHPLFAGSLP